MNIQSIEIEKFRKLKNVNIDFGEYITLIAGQNGTMKSSILGLIGEVFDFEKKVNKRYPNGFYTLSNSKFNKKLEEAFIWAYPEYDKPKEHIYFANTNINGEARRIQVKSYKRTEKGVDKGLRIVVEATRKSGDGDIEYPIIHLSLSRLYSLPDLKDLQITNELETPLTEEEEDFLVDMHNRILLLNEKQKPQFVSSSVKSFIGGKATTYDTRGYSAGQDNVNQILTAILSFKRLNETYNEYCGGILLIDEIDATLFPAAQIILFEELHKIARTYNLQIIATTHSLDIIRKALETKYANTCKVIFLSRIKGSIVPLQDLNLRRIENEIYVRSDSAESLDMYKTNLFCEDIVAKRFLQSVLKTKYGKYVKYYHNDDNGYSHATLFSLSKFKLPMLKDAIYILDGDQRNKYKEKIKGLPFLFLPTDLNIEILYYKMLNHLDESDTFWTEKFYKSLCFKTYSYKQKYDKITNTNDPNYQILKNNAKLWYKENRSYFGTSDYKMVNLFQRIYPEQYDDFLETFIKVFNSVSSYKIE